MEYVIFDLEWNQPAAESETVTEPVPLSGEIVEIGAVKLNSAFEVISEKRLLIKPTFYPRMHRLLASLTGVYDRILQEQGIPFPEACADFFSWCGADFAFMTWSQSDMPVLIENMLAHRMDVSNLPDCIDVQRIFGREIMRTDQQISLEHAMEVMGETGARAHDALHDSQNTAKVLSHMDLDSVLDDYITRIFVLPQDEVCYPTSQAARDAQLTAPVECPWCGQEMTAESWVSGKHGKWLLYYPCDEGDEFLLEMHCHRVSGGVRTHRLLYEMSNDLWDSYCDRRERLLGAV